MNIYHIGWTQSESFGLNAVVIAATEAEALKQLDLDDSYNSEIRVTLIELDDSHNSKIRVTLMGVCTDGTKTAQTVCKESL